MNFKDRYKDLISGINERVTGGYYNEENYFELHNKIVNQFAEERLDKILANSIEPVNKDVDDMTRQLKSRLENPECSNWDLTFAVRHMLQTWDELFFEGIDPKNIDDVLNILVTYGIKINRQSVERYYKKRSTILLSERIFEKYKKLFQVYLTIDDSIISPKDIDDDTKFFIHRYIKGLSIINPKKTTWSMRDIILRLEERNLRIICEINDTEKYGNFIENLYVFYNITEKKNFNHYVQCFRSDNDLWSLTILSLLLCDYDNIEDKPYLDPIITGNLFIDYEIGKDQLSNNHLIKISESSIFWDIKRLYNQWTNNSFFYQWDNFWNDEIKKYYKNRITSVEKLKINEFISASNQKPELPITKKQKISKEITEEVLLYFANYCERHREDTFKEIEERVIEHFQYKFAETTLRNWLKNNCRHCDVVKGKTPTEIIKIITVDIAEKWYKYFLKAKGR